ncbi:hypothetical protein ScPMuIL_002067 [Solemya velum]
MGGYNDNDNEEVPTAFRQFETSSERGSERRGLVRKLKTRPIFQILFLGLLITIVFIAFSRFTAPISKKGKVGTMKKPQTQFSQNIKINTIQHENELNRYQDLLEDYYNDFVSSTTPMYSTTGGDWTDFFAQPLAVNEPKPPAIARYDQPIKEIVNLLYNEPDPEYSTFFSNMDRLVHLDLKGAPPKLSYLQKFIPLIKSLGATGLLIEYEDMFPYDGALKNIAATNAYSKSDIAVILEEAKKNDLKVIPLVQTFGHMEFVLKYKEYIPLREREDNPQVITPTQEQSYQLVFAMLQQIRSLHSNIEYIHLGCDEVYDLGTGKSAAETITKDEIFLKHVTKVAEYVKTLGLKAIIWDDMMRKMDEGVIQAAGIGDVVQPMVWCYVPRPMSKLPREIWGKYGRIFGNVWVASAFKGATGSFRFMTDAFYHEQNHLNWVEIMKAFGGRNDSVVKFNGIAMTGWQRYDHFAILCELLPAAIPSLGASLLTMRDGGFNPKIHQQLTSMLGCNRTVPLRLPGLQDTRTENCKFPGSELYYDLLKLWALREVYDYSKGMLSGWVSDYNMKYQYSSPYQVKRLIEKLTNFSQNFATLEIDLNYHLKEIYGVPTIQEWMDVNIKHFVSEISSYGEKLQYLLRPKVWPKRPLLSDAKNVKESIQSPPVTTQVRVQSDSSRSKQPVEKQPEVKEKIQSKQPVENQPEVKEKVRSKQPIEKQHTVEEQPEVKEKVQSKQPVEKQSEVIQKSTSQVQSRADVPVEAKTKN